MDEKRENAMWDAFNELPDDIQRELEEIMAECKTKKEFISAVCIGACPLCSSKKTSDGEDAGIRSADATVGICLECGYVCGV